MFQKVYMGELDKDENKNLEPLHWQEIAVLVPLIIVIFWIGLQPAPFFATMDASTAQLVSDLGRFIPTVAQVAP
jgi:NADH-quinone oxidoreductase subunit M